MIHAEIICHHDKSHVSSHICHMLQGPEIIKKQVERLGQLLDQC